MIALLLASAGLSVLVGQYEDAMSIAAAVIIVGEFPDLYDSYLFKYSLRILLCNLPCTDETETSSQFLVFFLMIVNFIFLCSSDAELLHLLSLLLLLRLLHFSQLLPDKLTIMLEMFSCEFIIEKDLV